MTLPADGLLRLLPPQLDPDGALRLLPPPQLDPDRIAEITRRVLARPAYREGLLSRLLRALLEWLAELLGRVGGGRVSDLLAWLLIGAAVAVVAALGIRFGRRISTDPKAGGRAAPGVRPPTAAGWRRQAESHEQAGRWREAVRCRYRALVADLADRGLVEEVAGRTAREYQQEITQALPAAAQAFTDVTATFQRAWYGATADQEDAARLRQLTDRVLAAT